MQLDAPEDMVTLGKVSGVFGVKGWVKIYSHTSPIQKIVKYCPLYLKAKDGWQAINVLKGQKQGKSVIAQFEGIADRDQAFSLIGTEIGISRKQLPEIAKDSYYWTDLEGLSVVSLQGEDLGTVDWIFNTGSNDVLVVKGDRERMIPWIEDDVIQSVDLDASRITVDWDAEF